MMNNLKLETVEVEPSTNTAQIKLLGCSMSCSREMVRHKKDKTICNSWPKKSLNKSSEDFVSFTFYLGPNNDATKSD